MIVEGLRWLGLACGAVAIAHAGWWLVLAAIALPRPRDRQFAPGGQRVAIVVPAHNEEAMVAATVQSLRRSAEAHGGPAGVYVVADNCSDSTAAAATSAGARVLERIDETRRGKGFALDYAIARLAQDERQPEVVIFVDADSEVSENLVPALVSSIRDGARVAQAYYAAGPGDEPLRKARRIAFALLHWTRPLGASRLGLGTSLKGNGMAFRWDIVRDGVGGHGLAEDAEMSLALARRGIRVAFEPRATVRGHMASNWAAAATQDLRWERGRSAIRGRAAAAAVSALRKRPAAANGPVEVLSLPLVPVAALALLAATIELVFPGAPKLGTTAVVSLAGYVVLGLAGARIAPRDLAALASAPRYAAYKLWLMVSVPRRPSKWNTTSRT
jgi:hypothetical protein